MGWPLFLALPSLSPHDRAHLPAPTQPEWLEQFGTPLAVLSAPLTDPPPSYQPPPKGGGGDLVVAAHDVAYGRPAWPMPRCLRRHADATTRAAVFAAALLDGKAVRCFTGRSVGASE